MATRSSAWLTFSCFLFAAVLVFVIFAIASRKVEPVIDLTGSTKEITQPSVTIIDPKRGAENATLTIVEFADYACEACATLDEALSRLLLAYPDDLRVVWKDAPNESLHPEALSAAVAARCADKQDAFWLYHDELFLRGALTETVLQEIAQDLELDKQEFENCRENEEPLPRIQKTLEEAIGLDLTATPTIFIGEERWIGALTFSELETIIEERLP